MIKNSSKTGFLRYAVMCTLCLILTAGNCVYLMAEEPLSTEEPAIDVKIGSLDDPFNVQTRAPGVLELFLKGIAELKKQMEPPPKPVLEIAPQGSVVPPIVPVKQPDPVEVKKPEAPKLNISGIIYDTDYPQAIINGKVVTNGEMVEGVTIVKIQPGRVDARFEGSDLVIKFNNP